MENNIVISLSYAHKDEPFAKELEKHLRILELQYLITSWYERDINSVREQTLEDQRRVDEAQVVLLLISPDFIYSDFCYDELKRAMQRHLSGEARVIPIILRPVKWQETSFGRFLEQLQPLPTNGKPVTKWLNRDLAFLDIATGIRKAVEGLAVKLHSSPKSFTSQEQLSRDGTIIASGNQLTELKELENKLLKSYSFIRGYDDIMRVSDDPKKKEYAKQSIENQSDETQRLLKEYHRLATKLGVSESVDIAQIAALFGEMEFRAIS